MGWSYPFWVGPLYPKGTKQENYLREYSKKLTTVEVDSSFYRIPSQETVIEWTNQTPEDFIFALKFPQSITHKPKLSFDPSKLEAFMENIQLLGSKLGPLLLQFPPNLKLDYEAFRKLVDLLPEGLYAVEFRNRSWLAEEIFSLLSDRNIALSAVNKPWGTGETTADFVYIRMEGDRNTVNGELGIIEKDKSTENLEIAPLISAYLDNNLDVFCYFSKYYSGYPPGDAAQLDSYVRRLERVEQDHVC